LLLVGLALSACSKKDGQIEGAEPIDCRLSGQAAFAHVCTSERMATPDGTVLTVRQPDGGFHRLLIVKDGRGVIAADGAEAVSVKSSTAGSIDVEAGGVTYRLPARTKP
jgi:hypothetical protein